MGMKRKFHPKDWVDEIDAWVSAGKTLREYGRQDGKPSRRLIDKWRKDDEDFRARIARARDDGFDALAEECLEIADDASNDWMERQDDDGNAIGWRVNGDHVTRSRLRIETRLKLLAKWDPKRYGDHVGQGPGDDPATFAARLATVTAAMRAATNPEPNGTAE